jgi:hypothetical protein
MLVVATTWPLALVERTPLVTPVSQVVPSVASVAVALLKVLRPVHVLLLARSVELAALTVILPPAVRV